MKARLKNAVVIGGGPAGASAAIGLLRSGLDVTLLEQRTQWQGRVCGAFLNPDAVQHLKELDVMEAVRQAEAVTVEATRITTSFGGETYVRTAQKGQPAMGLSRRILEEILLKAVEGAGGRVEIGARARGLAPSEKFWTVAAQQGGEIAREYRGELIVLADGRFSPTFTPRQEKPSAGWFGWNASFDGVRQAPGEMSLHFYPGGYVGVLTFADGKSNVCGLRYRGAEEAFFSWDNIFEDALKRQAAFRLVMVSARRRGEWRGVGPLPFTARMKRSDGPLLTGDAAAVGDPFMGEGIGRALAAGPILFECLNKPGNAADIAARYEKIWKRHYTSRLRLGVIFRQIFEHSFLYGPACRALLLSPGLLNALTPLFHQGYRAPRNIGWLPR